MKKFRTLTVLMLLGGILGKASPNFSLQRKHKAVIGIGAASLLVPSIWRSNERSHCNAFIARLRVAQKDDVVSGYNKASMRCINSDKVTRGQEHQNKLEDAVNAARKRGVKVEG
jgi:hypothetical protein